MAFIIRQISRTSDGREIVRPVTFETVSIAIGRNAASEIHLVDLAVELNHATVTQLNESRIEVSALGGRKFSIDGRSVETVEIDTVKGAELRFGSHRLSVSKDGAITVISVERFEALSDASSEKEEIGLFTLNGLLTGRRRAAWSLVGFMIALFLAWPMYSYSTSVGVKNRSASFHADTLWNSGPLSAAHKKLSNDCQACHTQKFVSVTDDTCRTCHKNSAHDHASVARLQSAKLPAGVSGKITGFFKTTFNKPEGRCVDCHTEHEGEPRMAPTKQAFCTDCHKALKSRLGDTTLANASDFGIDHPQFQVAVTQRIETNRRLYRRVSLDIKPTENNGLIFPHGVHLEKGGSVARMAQTMRGDQAWGASLVCKDCHSPSADKSRFQPVQMEKNCQMCHSLSFGNGRVLKHGEPGQVVAQIRSFYSGQGPLRPASLNQTSRRRPGDYAAFETAQDYAFGSRIWQSQASQAVSAIFSKGGACFDCHIISPVASQGAPVSIHPVVQPDRYMKKGWFDHLAHNKENCATCHNAATSTKATDLLLPGIATCRNCHVGEGGDRLQPVKTPIISSCALCHDYHPGNGAPWRSKLKIKRLDQQRRSQDRIASAF